MSICDETRSRQIILFFQCDDLESRFCLTSKSFIEKSDFPSRGFIAENVNTFFCLILEAKLRKMSVSLNAFRWLDILEKEFDKAFVDLDLLLGEIDQDQSEITDDGRSKMTVLSSCFAQLAHKSQTIIQANAKLEVGQQKLVELTFENVSFSQAQLIDARAEIVEIKADRDALDKQTKDIMAQLHTSQLECQILKNQGEIEGADTIRRRLVCLKIELQKRKKEKRESSSSIYL